MIIGTAGYDLDIPAHQSLTQCLGIVNDILLIYFKVVA